MCWILFLLLTAEVKKNNNNKLIPFVCVCLCVLCVCERACAPQSACELYHRSVCLRLQQRSGQEFTGLPQTRDFFFFFFYFSVIVEESSEQISEGEAAPRITPDPLMDIS